MKTTLVIMAAGIGSRFGKGIKQLEPVGPTGEVIMEYSIYDALAAGFDQVVFIIRPEMEDYFKEVVGDRVAKVCPVAYAYQDSAKLPGGHVNPEGRTKPWGTGHAVLACRGIVDTPFIVINADDYYGKEAFKRIHDYLVAPEKSGKKYDFCMAGFIIRNTLSENGGVTRGICRVSEQNDLIRVVETGELVMTERGVEGTTLETKEDVVIDPNAYVSMNMWGLTPAFIDVLHDGFCAFLDEHGTEMKAEYLLPAVIDQLVQSGEANVKVLETPDKWFGVTYHEDKDVVVRSFAKLTEEGKYPEKLF